MVMNFCRHFGSIHLSTWATVMPGMNGSSRPLLSAVNHIMWVYHVQKAIHSCNNWAPLWWCGGARAVDDGDAKQCQYWCSTFPINNKGNTKCFPALTNHCDDCHRRKSFKTKPHTATFSCARNSQDEVMENGDRIATTSAAGLCSTTWKRQFKSFWAYGPRPVKDIWNLTSEIQDVS